MAIIHEMETLIPSAPTRDSSGAIVRLSQSENGRTLQFRILGITIPAGSTTYLSGTKPDGVVYSKAGTVHGDDYVFFTEDVQLTAVAGNWDARIHILNNGQEIGTARLTFIIDKDPVDVGAIPSDSQLDGLVAEVQAYVEEARSIAFGSPLTASTADQMTDGTKVYVYTGSESGYTNGHWYYFDGTDWVDGGVYNAVAVQTDTTLTRSGVAADAKVTGDEITGLKEDLSYIYTAIDGGGNVFNTLKLSGNNGAVVSNGDGSYTIGTSDYGLSWFGIPVLVKAGCYLLYGVPQGMAYLSTSSNYTDAVFSNTSATPKRIFIESDTRLYLGFRIVAKPSSSFSITPFLLNTKIAENAKNVEQAKEDLTLYNCSNVFNGVHCENYSRNNISFTQNVDGSVTINGTPSSSVFIDYDVPVNALPSWFQLGKKYYIKYSSSKVWFRIYKYVGATFTLVVATKNSTQFVINEADSLRIRLTVDSGDQVNNETVHPVILNAPISGEKCGEFALSSYREITDISIYSKDADNFTDHGFAFISYDSNTPADNWSNMPEDQAFWLLCITDSVYHFYTQIAFPFKNDGNVWRRVKGFDGWGTWQLFSGNVVNNTFNSYENTYNITASPSITTDTNAYLAPTGDSTDVTSSIASMLSTYGICRLGKGDYYIKNLTMPESTKIIGVGTATKIHMLSGDGCAIQMSDFCMVKDLQMIGDSSVITPSSTVRNRHAILWAGTYTDNNNAPYKSIISGVYIRDFTGGGITCQDTGYGQANSINVDSCYILRCDAGININYWSEFNRFTGVKCHSCYYGCVNNGGNNMFVNCDFSANRTGFLMDNSSNQSPNNSHGSAIGCIFNHSGSDNGIGIQVLNCPNGYIFNGCQIFFSQIDIQDSDGIVISDTNFGQSNCNISVSGGGAVLFANNMYQGSPTISITNNTNVHFSNCYVRSTGAPVTA